MKRSVGSTAAGTQITSTDPRVQALVQKGLSIDAAIGSVAGSRTSPTPTGIPSPTPTPTPSPTLPATGATPTTATTGTGKFSYELTADEIAAQKARDEWLSINTPGVAPDASEIYKTKLTNYQDQIDAMNKLYNDQLNKALAAQAVTGRGRVGTNTAIQARSGQLGSSFGAAATDTINTGNMNEANAISAEINNRRAEAISSIMGQVRDSADSEFKARTEARRQGADALVEYYSKLPERKAASISNVISMLIAQGIDPSLMNPNELKAVADQLRVSSNDIISSYKEESTKVASAKAKETAALEKTKAETEKLKSESQTTLKPGDVVVDASGNVIYTAPAGGNTGFTLGPGESRYSADGTKLAEGPAKAPTLPASAQEYEYYKDQEIAANRKPMTYEQYQTADANRKAVRINTGGGTTATERKAAQQAEDIRLLNSHFSSKVGEDGHLNNKDYQAAKAEWVGEGYTAQSFDQAFSHWVDPRHAADYGVGFQTKVSANAGSSSLQDLSNWANGNF